MEYEQELAYIGAKVTDIKGDFLGIVIEEDKVNGYYRIKSPEGPIRYWYPATDLFLMDD